MPSQIHPFTVGGVPSPLAHVHYARHDPLRDLRGEADSAVVVIDVNKLPVFDITPRRVNGVDPYTVRFDFAHPGHVVPGRVGPGFVMGRQQLKRVFCRLGRVVTLGVGHVFRNCRDQGVFQFFHVCAVDFDFA